MSKVHEGHRERMRARFLQEGADGLATHELLEMLPLDDNNAVFNLCCSLCSAFEQKAFRDGLQYGAHLLIELYK